MENTYRIAMPDFLFKGGLDFAKIIEWYKPRKFKKGSIKINFLNFSYNSILILNNFLFIMKKL